MKPRMKTRRWMRMWTRVGCVLAFALVVLATHPGFAMAADSGAADVPPAAPTDFAFGRKFETTGSAAAFRATLPPEVYRGVTNAELRDLAVFNGRDEVVPHVLARAIEPSDHFSAVIRLPVFPLRGNDSAVMEALRVTIESREGKVDLALPEEGGTGAAGADKGLIRSYILDGRSLVGVADLRLGWAEDAPEFAGRLRVEGSETLGDWRTIVDAAPIANLRAGNARLTENRIDMRYASAKYYRLTWLGTPAPFEITSVNAQSGGRGPALRRSSLVLEGKPVAGRRGEFEFDAGGYFPVDYVNLELPELNSVVEVSLLSRASASQPWRSRGDPDGFYRLQGTDAELVNGDVRVSALTDRYWLVRVNTPGSGLGSGVPRLKIAWPGHEILFLARGPGPFTLAYGNGALNVAPGRIEEIPRGARILDASLGERQTVGGESRRFSASARAPGKSVVLWGVLGLGVALLGYMAWRLSGELRRGA